MNKDKGAQYYRGDIVLVKFPLITDYSKHKNRPALIIQNNIGNRYSRNLIVASISSTIPPKRYPTHLHVPKDDRETGLNKDSVIQFENILTIPKRLVVSKLGSIPDKYLDSVDNCIMISLGIEKE
jgi:mRNA interferase MazF